LTAAIRVQDIMRIEEADLPLLKTWLIKRLEDMYVVRKTMWQYCTDAGV